mgnify:CR=1 FL=1
MSNTNTATRFDAINARNDAELAALLARPTAKERRLAMFAPVAAGYLADGAEGAYAAFEAAGLSISHCDAAQVFCLLLTMRHGPVATHRGRGGYVRALTADELQEIRLDAHEKFCAYVGLAE